MAFFNQMGGGGMAPTIGGGGASAFTSPGIDPMTLAMLLRMQSGGGQQGAPGMPPPPQMPGPPQAMGGAGGMPGSAAAMLGHMGQAMPGGVPSGASTQPGGQNLMQILSQMNALGGGGTQGAQGGGLMQLLRSLGIGSGEQNFSGGTPGPGGIGG